MQMPESSERAGRPLARVAATALIAAFSENIIPSSVGSGRPSSPAETSSMP